MNKAAKKFLTWILVIVALFIIFLFMGPFYIIDEGNQVVVTRFGSIVNTHTDAGLHIKVPFLDKITTYPKLVLSLDGDAQRIPTKENQFIIVDTTSYHKGESAPKLSGQWCAVGSFVVTGVTNTDTFTKKYAAEFDGRLEELRAAVQSLGGVLLAPVAGADLTCEFQVTPFFPVRLQFWEGDEEFAPKLLLLWDRNTDKFLHFETTFYLQGDLLNRLRISAGSL